MNHRCPTCRQWIPNEEDPENIRRRFAVLRDLESVSRGMSPAPVRLRGEIRRQSLPLWVWFAIGAGLALCWVAVLEGIA